jgi:hypothetical protein
MHRTWVTAFISVMPNIDVEPYFLGRTTSFGHLMCFCVNEQTFLYLTKYCDVDQFLVG